MAIARHTEVVHVSAHHGGEVGALLRDGCVHALPKDGFHFLQLRLSLLSYRLPEQREPTFPVDRARMRESQKVEGLGSALSSPAPVVYGKPAELHQASFTRVQSQAELREAFAQFVQKLLGLITILESNNEVVSKPHDDNIALSLLRSPPLNPQIEHVVKVDVGQERADTTALHRTLIAPGP